MMEENMGTLWENGQDTILYLTSLLFEYGSSLVTRSLPVGV